MQLCSARITGQGVCRTRLIEFMALVMFAEIAETEGKCMLAHVGIAAQAFPEITRNLPGPTVMIGL